jgi:xanthine dehydrogenase accessory factor
MNVFDRMVLDKQRGVEFVLCVVTHTKGSVPRGPGAKMLVYRSGGIFGTIGGGRVEKRVIEDALTVMEANRPVMVHYDLLKQLGMSCGGSLDIYMEPVMKKRKLYILGAGHTGVALSHLAARFDFDITIVDDRREYIESFTQDGVRKVHGQLPEVLDSLEFDANTFITIMTYTHSIDRELLAYCLRRPHAYLGMMGSRRKVELTRKMFIEEGIATAEQLDQVDMPMGIEIAADGPDEIAVSIIARLILVKNQSPSI